MSMERWSFGPFRFDASEYRLVREGRGLSVQPKPLDLLACLLRVPGALVTRETLETVLYPDITVTEHALRNVVLKLREALGPEHEGWVETVPRKGVRFVGPVVVDGQTSGEGAPPARFGYHLPAERDRFVGRASEREALADALGEARLVTLIGAGGVGKTRLALHHAWKELARWPGGVWFCDLADADTPEGVARAVARALDLPLGVGDPLAQLGHAIAARGRCLVILDDFEPLVRWAQPIVGAWLERAPEAQILVTSRERLRLTGEHLVDLGPLSLEDGATLFVDRARAVDRRFVLPETDALLALVAMLDALPLAIELAAGRVRVMSIAAITARMTDRSALLASDGGRMARHATLRVVLDDSWALLSASEQGALAWLSSFEGGFSLEAVEGVLDASGGWPVALLERLVDASLVRVVPRDGDKRFDLLACVRAYATERLSALGSDAVAAERHGVFFARLASDAIAQLDADERLVPELSNLVVACRRAVARGDGACAVATLRGVWAVVELKGPFSLGYELARRVLSETEPRTENGWASWVLGLAALLLGRTDEAEGVLGAALARADRGTDRMLVAYLHRSFVGLRLSQGRFEEARASVDAALHETRAVGELSFEPKLFLLDADIDRLTGNPTRARLGYEATLAAARRVGDLRSECLARMGLGVVLHHHLGELAGARAMYEEALVLARARSAVRDEGRLLGHLGAWFDAAGSSAQAVARLEQALALHRRIGHRYDEGVDLGRLGQTHAGNGRPAEARPVLEAALAIHRELGTRREEGVVLGNLGAVWLALGHPSRAESCLDEALAIHRAHRNRRFEGLVSVSLAEVYRAAGDLERTRRTLEVALAIHREIGNTVEQAHTLGQLASLWMQRGDLGSAAELAADGVRLLRESDDRRDLPALLCICAEIEIAAGRHRTARAAISEAETLASDRDDPVLRATLARLRTEGSKA